MNVECEWSGSNCRCSQSEFHVAKWNGSGVCVCAFATKMNPVRVCVFACLAENIKQRFLVDEIPVCVRVCD